MRLITTAKIKSLGIQAGVRAYGLNSARAHQDFELAQQFRANPSAGKIRVGIQSFQPIAVNGTPSHHLTVYLGNQDLYLADLLFHAGDGEVSCPSFGF